MSVRTEERKVRDISYILNRSKIRRSTSIEVRDGTVRVCAPISLPLTLIEDFIVRKADWIRSKLSDWSSRSDNLSELKNLERFLLHGNSYIAEFSNVKKLTVCGDKFFIPMRLQNEPQKLIRAILRFYKGYALTYLRQRTEELAAVSNCSFNSFHLTNAQRKWGSCSGAGDIRLNWRLVLLDIQLSDYVIFHELCHTKYHNHGKNFWFLLETIYPNYKNAKKILKEQALIIGLYR